MTLAERIELALWRQRSSPPPEIRSAMLELMAVIASEKEGAARAAFSRGHSMGASGLAIDSQPAVYYLSSLSKGGS